MPLPLHSSKLSPQLHYPPQQLYRELPDLLVGIEEGLVFGIKGDEHQAVAALFEALDGGFLADEGNDDIAGVGGGLPPDTRTERGGKHRLGACLENLFVGPSA